jgi:hypothetical protein
MLEGEMEVERTGLKEGFRELLEMRIWRAELTIFLRTGYLQVPRCVCLTVEKRNASVKHRTLTELWN